MTAEDLVTAQSLGIAPWTELVADLGRVKIFADKYPVTAGHRLFIPERNIQKDIVACFREAYQYGSYLVEMGACHAFNVGMNIGSAAGQTVMYPHIHCIPRQTGDCADPVGGVRAVIPGQANYKKSTYKNPTDK